MADEQQIPEIKLDPESLYREETITDGKSGTIRRLIPVTANGDDDTARDVRYEGNTTLMTPAGSLPINFELEVNGLAEALEQFPEAAKGAIERTMDELQEMRRQQQGSGLYVPGQGGQGAGMGGLGGQQPGGAGGNIQF